MDVDSNKQKSGFVCLYTSSALWYQLGAGKIARIRCFKNVYGKRNKLYPGANSTVPENNKQFTGDYLMTIGLNISQSQAAASAVIEITAN